MAVTEGGALVRGSDDGPAILKDSPAAKAGLEAEDIILEINGIKVDENNSLGNLIQRYSVGESIMAKIRRGLPGQGEDFGFIHHAHRTPRRVGKNAICQKWHWHSKPVLANIIKISYYRI